MRDGYNYQPTLFFYAPERKPNMIPSVGRIVHAKSQPDIPCRAMIITGVDYGNGKPVAIHGTVFRNRGDGTDYAVIVDESHWHDPYFCPETISAQQAQE